MDAPRYLCSELVILKRGARETVVNLEEIWISGAVVESEEPLETGESVQIRAGTVRLSGTVSAVEQHEFGWRSEIQFSPLTPWRIDAFRPQHLLDPEEL